jgi:nitrile hydratase
VDGVHDLGGMQDFGPVVVEPNEPAFHAPWEGRVFGLVATLSAQRLYSMNAFRHAIERMDPAHYLGSSYYEHWLTAVATLLIERGIVEPEELDGGFGESFLVARPMRAPRWRADRTATAAQPTRFRVGDRVRVREMHPRGHTRCPRYVRGRRGVVERCEGECVLPDAEVHGEQPPTEQTYCVRFDSAELWGAEAEPDATVSVDLWDSYLEAA